MRSWASTTNAVKARFKRLSSFQKSVLQSHHQSCSREYHTLRKEWSKAPDFDGSDPFASTKRPIVNYSKWCQNNPSLVFRPGPASPLEQKVGTELYVRAAPQSHGAPGPYPPPSTGKGEDRSRKLATSVNPSIDTIVRSPLPPSSCPPSRSASSVSHWYTRKLPVTGHEHTLDTFATSGRPEVKEGTNATWTSDSVNPAIPPPHRDNGLVSRSPESVDRTPGVTSIGPHQSMIPRRSDDRDLRDDFGRQSSSLLSTRAEPKKPQRKSVRVTPPKRPRSRDARTTLPGLQSHVSTHPPTPCQERQSLASDEASLPLAAKEPRRDVEIVKLERFARGAVQVVDILPRRRTDTVSASSDDTHDTALLASPTSSAGSDASSCTSSSSIPELEPRWWRGSTNKSFTRPVPTPRGVLDGELADDRSQVIGSNALAEEAGNIAKNSSNVSSTQTRGYTPNRHSFARKAVPLPQSSGNSISLDVAPQPDRQHTSRSEASPSIGSCRPETSRKGHKLGKAGSVFRQQRSTSGASQNSLASTTGSCSTHFNSVFDPPGVCEISPASSVSGTGSPSLGRVRRRLRKAKKGSSGSVRRGSGILARLSLLSTRNK